jgi:hypothetical protein
MVTISKTRHGRASPPPMRRKVVGVYLCADGGEVLFIRNGQPILQRDPGQPPRMCSPTDWFEYVSKQYFRRGERPIFYHLIEIAFMDGEPLEPYFEKPECQLPDMLPLNLNCFHERE